MTRRAAATALALLLALFALRMSLNAGATLRSVDEAHYCVVAARLVDDGGPLYANAMSFAGPVGHWLIAGVFRLAGVYAMPAYRLAAVGWWAATAVALYVGGRSLFGRPASLAAAGAFLLAAMNPGFQDLRIETLTPLPVALGVAFCARGVARRQAVCLALAGAAAAGAFLIRQQSGPLVGAIASLPLLAWAWRREPGGGWRAVCGAALVASGFVAALAAVGLWLALRGAGHEAFYCLWTFNWSYLRHCTPGGGYLPTPAFLAVRLVRFLRAEAFLPMALVGAVVGLGWRGGRDEAGAIPWRATGAFLAVLAATMAVVASPANKFWLLPHSYISYVAFLYVPMSLLVGLCVEAATRGGDGRRLAWAAAGLAVAYVVVPALRPTDSVAMRLGIYSRAFPLGLWRLAAALPAMACAGALVGGRAAAAAAPAAWALVYLAAPRALGWEGAHLPAALGMLAVGLLWQARQRRALWLAAAAGVVHAAACRPTWSPQVGVVVGAGAWLLLQGRLRRREAAVLALAYVVPAAGFGLWVAFAASARPLCTLGLAARADALYGTLLGRLAAWRLSATLALAGAALAAWASGGRREGLRRARDGPFGLLALAVAGALAGGLMPALAPDRVTVAGTALVLGAALGAVALARRGAAPAGLRASLLLGCGCAVAAVCALVRGLEAPVVRQPTKVHARLAEAMGHGSRAYVWGSPFEVELYVRARAVPAAPQIFPWLLEGVGPPPLGEGLYGYPPVATREALDRGLCEALPPTVVVMAEPRPTIAELPRFGPLLRRRYRVAASLPEGTVYRLVEP
ncbi:MAG: glycosyltransferase family 39 protein [Candidatus Brocadiia bacterium]